MRKFLFQIYCIGYLHTDIADLVEFYIIYIQYTINTIGTSGLYIFNYTLYKLIICWGPSALSAPHASDVI
jgi:hypothetical protein